MIKAVFLDVDGTMVSFKTHQMSDATYESLSALQRKGVKVVICTGRPWYCVDNVRDFPFDACISCNGGLAYADGKLLLSRSMAKDSACNIADIVTREHIPCITFFKDRCIINCINDASIKMGQDLNFPRPPFGDIVRIVEDEEVYEMTAFIDVAQTDSLLRPYVDGVEFIRWHPDFVDITPANVNKALGVDCLLDYWGFSRDEAMAFGDGGNDVPMFKAVGIGVAMGNATDDVKSSADYVTLTVEQNGVGAALRHFGIL